MNRNIRVGFCLLLLAMAVFTNPVQGEAGGRTVYLTFDDGPSVENTESILDLLKQNGIRATFFINGPIHEKSMSVSEWKRVVKRIHDEGHLIGNHTYDHEYTTVYRSSDRFLGSVDRLDAAVYTVCGVHTSVLRFPGGSNTGYINRVSHEPGLAWRVLVPELTRKGYSVYDWNVSSGDAAGKTVPRLVIQTYVKKGVLKQSQAIILHHDSAEKTTTVQALREEIRWMRANRYRFDTVDHLSRNYFLSRGWVVR